MKGLILTLLLTLSVVGCREIPPLVPFNDEADGADVDDEADGELDDAAEPDIVDDEGCDAQAPRCEGDVVITCEGDVEVRTTCPTGNRCEDGACVQASCEPNTATCDGEGAVLSCPPEGGEPQRIVCDEQSVCREAAFGCGCRQGQCRQRVCEPGTSACVEGGSQRCSEDGFTLEGVVPCVGDEICLEGSCVEQVCTPNRARCEGDILRLCNAEGTSERSINCSGDRFCNPEPSARCDDRACAPDAVRCDDDRLARLICDEMGSVETRELCPPGEFCEGGACQARRCSPDERFCLNGDVHQCDNIGAESFPVVVCEEGLQTCQGGACVALVCEAGLTRCEGEVLVACNDTGTEERQTDCEAAESFCDSEGGECLPWICEPGSGAECFEGDVRACDERGTGFDVVERCEDRGCQDGQCSRLEDGEACTTDEACLSENCSQGRCLPEEFALVPAGQFLMGSAEDEPGRSAPEGPQHEVSTSRDLWAMRREVTQRDWADLMRNNPSVHRGNGLRPVDSVSWFDALAYANARSRFEDLPECYDLAACTGSPGTGDFTCPTTPAFSLNCAGYRLPTEAEWEYMARGGTETALPSGDISVTDCGDEPNLIAIGWYCGNAGDTSHPVGIKAPNPWGLYDTAGNLFEWVWDWFDGGYYALSPDQDPLGPELGTRRVIRGGSWSFQARGARSAFRLSQSPEARTGFLGFRLVRSAPQ